MQGDKGDAREASFRGAARRRRPLRTRTHASTHARTHGKDCFGSRRLCRGNANSHARGDIHNTMPLITHCLCDGTVLLIPSSFSPPSLEPFSHSLSVSPPSLILISSHSREGTSRIRANRNKIRNASVLATRSVIWPSLYYFFIHLIMISFQRERLAYPFYTGRRKRGGQRGGTHITHAQLEINYSLNRRRPNEVSVIY